MQKGCSSRPILWCLGPKKEVAEATKWVENTLGGDQRRLFIIEVGSNANGPLHGHPWQIRSTTTDVYFLPIARLLACCYLLLLGLRCVGMPWIVLGTVVMMNTYEGDRFQPNSAESTLCNPPLE